MSLNISSIIERNYNDFSSVLAKKSNWMEMDFLDKKILSYTRPHSEDTYNPFRMSTFLYHFKKTEWFNFFPILMIRDGHLSILHFFYNHPEPKDINTIFILPYSARNIIPPAWQDQCLIYQIKRDDDYVLDKAKNLYLTTSVSSDLYELEYIEKCLQLASKKALPLYGLFFRHEAFGEESIDTNDNHDYTFLNKLNSLTNQTIELVDWKKTQNSDLSHSSFMNLNQNNFWYNDSSVSHLFLSQGAKPLNNKTYPFEKYNKETDIKISQYHFYHLEQVSRSARAEGARCWEYIEGIPSHVFPDEKLLDRKAQDFKKIFICSKEFKSLSLDLVREYCLNETV